MKIACGVVMALMVVVLASPASAFSEKVFRDWYAFCDDQLTCHMQARPEGDDIYTVEFSRAPAASAPVTFSLSHRGILKENSAIVFEISAELERFELPLSDGVFANGVWRFENPDIESLLMPALIAGNEVIVTIQTDIGQFRETASLSGSSAAMLWIDEQQNRLERTDALVAKGNKPAVGRKVRSSVVERGAELPEPVLAQWRLHPGQCESDFAGANVLDQFTGVRILVDENENVSVYILPCGGPGAYNIIHAGFVYDQQSGEARPLFFASMFDKGPGVLTTIVTAGWNEEQNRLYAFAKGRGLGDCGTESAWQWDGNGIWGTFILVEERSKADCDGNYETPWPQVWPAR